MILLTLTCTYNDIHAHDHFVQNLATGDSAQSVTSNIVTVTDEIHGPKAPMWVDTPGKKILIITSSSSTS